MRGVFDDREIQQVAARHDTELTLGSTALLLILFGLILLCGVCFGLGYATGRPGTQNNAEVLPATGAASAITSTAGAQPKPSAGPQTSATQPAESTDPQEPADSTATDADASNPAAPAADNSSHSSSSSNSQAQVKPAFTSPAISAQAALPSAAAVVPALGAAPLPAGSLMVQIAAVSQQTDADVLMGALRKHGYAVAGHREPLDGLIHVRIGPFTTRDEAEKWRIKLLNDGYNAIVQP